MDEKSLKALKKAFEKVRKGEVAPKGGFVANVASSIASASISGEINA
jgi:hypothetical protein